MIRLLAVTLPLHAATPDWLPATPLATPQIADTRETVSGVVVRTGDPTLDAAVADRFGIVRVPLGPVNGQLDLAAGIYLGFLPGGQITFDITTLDGLIRLPATFTWEAFTGTLEWAHISAHYADGVRKLDTLPPESGSWSREYFRVALGWESPMFRPYAAFRQILHVLPEVPRPGVQAGMSVWGPWNTTPYAATDGRWDAENGWRTAFAGQAGVAFRSGEGPTFLLALAGRTGPDDTGKLSGDSDRYLGVYLGFLRSMPTFDPSP